jgi:hypothetical protein
MVSMHVALGSIPNTAKNINKKTIVRSDLSSQKRIVAVKEECVT